MAPGSMGARLPHHCCLIGGAGLPPWAWEEAVRHLGEGRSVAVARRPPDAKARLAEYAQVALDSAPAERFAVVAHSSGGVVTAQLLGLAPQRVSAVLAVAAVVPKSGGSFLSSMPFPNRVILDVVMRFAGTRPPESAMRRGLPADVDAAIADRFVPDFTPESPGLYRDRVADHAWPQRRGYLVTSRDRDLPPKLQRQFVRTLAATWQDEIGTGHLPMLEQPARLARAIEAFDPA